MHRYTRALVGIVAGAAVFAAGALAGQTMFDGGSDAGGNAVQLPSACDNFLAASEMFAEQGASAAISGGGGDPLAPDAQTKAYDTLSGLLRSCDQELALRGK